MKSKLLSTLLVSVALLAAGQVLAAAPAPPQVSGPVIEGLAAAPAPAAKTAAVKPKNRRKTCNDMRVPAGAQANTDAKPDDGVKPSNGVKPKVLC